MALATVTIETTELKDLLTFMMVNDRGGEYGELEAFADRASQALGFSGWIDAYHQLP